MNEIHSSASLWCKLGAAAPLRQLVSRLTLTLQRHHVTGLFGLDFGQERLHLVQLDKRSGRCQVRAYASIAYPESRAALTASPKALKALLKLGR